MSDLWKDYNEPKFHGQVRIADVQEAFDEIIKRVNYMVDAYNNNESNIEKVDYTRGAKSLAPAGYSLSVGGLKKVLEAYDGVVIGCKAIRISSTQVKMTAGMLITKDRGIQLPDDTVAVGSSTKTIYFDKSNHSYTTISSDSTVKICDINMNRESVFVSDRDNVQVENIRGSHNIYTESRTFSDFASGKSTVTPIPIDTSDKPKFVCGIDRFTQESEGTNRLYLLGTEVASNKQTGHKNLNYWTPVNFLYLPKGTSNPYTVSKRKDGKYYDSTKSFDVIEELILKDE